MSGGINVITRKQIIIFEPISKKVSIINVGGSGAADTLGTVGPVGPTGPTGATGISLYSTKNVILVHPLGFTSGVATNLSSVGFTAIADPFLRTIVDLRGMTKVRMICQLGGSIYAGTQIAIQYHTGGDVNVASGDVGWTTLCESTGSHTVFVTYYTGELVVPSGARINNCIIRAGLTSGDFIADPSMTQCMLDFYA